MASLPGLSLSAAVPDPVNLASTASQTRYQDLAAKTEYRFEVSFSRTLTIRLLHGTAEFFGTELGSSTTYRFKGIKGAIFTWHGCKLEIVGEAESEYVAEETTMMSCLNAHSAIEVLRNAAAQSGEEGPKVLVIGPNDSGKTSLVRILTSYAVKKGQQPLVVNLDPRQGMLSMPGSLTAAAFSSIIDVEEGWGSSPISGPSPIPVKMPLTYHYGLANPEKDEKIFKPLVTRMALAVTSRMEADKDCKSAGLIIDTPGVVNPSPGKGDRYDQIEHIISEFSVNVVFIIGSERLYSDISRKYANRTEEPVYVIRLDKSGGCVDRDESYMKQLRQAQIRQYFFGTSIESTLAPHSQTVDFGDLAIYKIVEPSDVNPAFRPGDDDDAIYGQPSRIYDRVTPAVSMQNSLLAITTAPPNDRHDVIRDSSVRGYIWIADVDEAKKKVRLLSPEPGHLPRNAMILGSFPEDVPELVG